MPIYEYRCSSCGAVSEVMQKVSDGPPERCPRCEAASTLTRLVSRTSFQLKGGGWYSDLYGSVKKEGSAEAPKEAAAPAKEGAAEPAKPAAAAPTPAAAPAASSGPDKS